MAVNKDESKAGEIPSFESREHAGRLLGERLLVTGLVRPLVLAVPRGGLPVAQAIARALGADLDIAPGPETERPEPTEFSGLTADRKSEADGFDPTGRDVVIVEDGITTGAAVLAAARRVRAKGAARVVIASPIVCGSAVEALLGDTGFELVALHVSKEYGSLGDFFIELEPVKDKDVHEVREAARNRHALAREASVRDVLVGADSGADGFETRHSQPSDAHAVIVGLGFSRLASWLRRDFVDRLNEAGYGVLTFDETVGESAKSTRQALEWLSKQPSTNRMPIGVVSIEKSAASAIEAAASVPELVRCLVCVDAVPADDAFLAHVMAPTLFIDGEDDTEAVGAARRLVRDLSCESALALVPGSLRGIVAQNGSIELSRAAIGWLDRFLSASRPTRGVDYEMALQHGARSTSRAQS